MQPESLSAQDPDQPPTTADSVLIVENMQSAIGDYLGTSNLRVLLLIVTGPAIALALVVFIFATQAYNQPGTLNWVGFIMLILLGNSAAHIRSLHDKALLERFARANHFDFQPTGTVDETYGTIFRVSPGLSHAADIVTGSYHDHPIRLFQFQFEVPAGRSSKTVYSTVCELDLAGRLPHLMLINQKVPLGLKFLIDDEGLGINFGPKDTVSLEGDFNQHFTLLAQPGGSQAALEVFTPDIMALMQDSATKFTTELVAGKVYIYSLEFLKQESDLANLFAVAEKLLPKLEPLAARMAQDPSIPMPTQMSLPAAVGLIPKSFSWKIVAIMIAIGMLFPLSVMLMLLISGHM